jgi:tetratricopeptide (TPR) repeat protein
MKNKITNIDTFCKVSEKAIAIYKSSVAKANAHIKAGDYEGARNIFDEAISDLNDMKEEVKGADNKIFDIAVSQGKELLAIAALDGFKQIVNYDFKILKKDINANTKVIKKEVLASAKNKTSIFDNEVVLDRMDDNIDKLKNFFSKENLIKSDRYEVDQIKKAGVDLKKFIKINRNNRTNKAFKSYAVGKFKGIGKDLRDGKLNGDNFKRTIGDKFNSIKKMYADCIGIYVTLLKTRKLFIKNK